MSTKQEIKRHAISVSGSTYDRLRGAVAGSASLHKFVDGIVTSMLDDPTILARVVGKCRPRATVK